MEIPLFQEKNEMQNIFIYKYVVLGYLTSEGFTFNFEMGCDKSKTQSFWLKIVNWFLCRIWR